ncbi:MAG: carbohydrate ABC transporter permease [Firmicutes bacterium]|nr:carbohydrate ABC transporter permease [Bacillota bacterium]
MKKTGDKINFENICINIFIFVSMTVLVIAILYPLINMAAYSLNDAVDGLRGKLYLLPRKFTLYNYRYLLSDIQIYNSLKITVLRTMLGSVTCVLFSTLLAYILSKRDFILRKAVTFLVVFTMYFSGGIIPIYILYQQLGLINNFLVYIIPGFVSAFCVIFLRSYIEGLPLEIVESAKIDGAKELTIFARIIVPMIIPMIAVAVLFTAVYQWNSWYDAYIYAPKKDLSTLQLELMKKLQQLTFRVENTNSSEIATRGSGANSITPRAVQYTMTIIAALPVILIYPFLQRYFVTGLTMGGVKG